MTEVPSEADMERMAVTAERTCGPSALPLWVRWWRANVRPAEPTDLPAGESLLRDELGVAVFRPPEEGEAWVGMHPTSSGVEYQGVCLTGLIEGFFGGRRFILAPKPTTAERIAADVRRGLARWSHETWNPKTAVTIAEVLVERGYKHPEET